MRFVTIVLVLLLAVGGAIAQADFECQGPLCGYTFPVGKGAPGDCEGVSWNGLGGATVDTFNGCGFPCNGQQYLRMVANGPVQSGPCQPPITPGGPIGLANEVYIPIPPNANQVRLCWDFYNCEGPNSMFNDGMLIDFVGFNCQHLGLIAFADTFKLIGPCVDGGAALCPSNCPGIDLGLVPGPEVAFAPVPANAAFIRVAVWNGFDNNNPSHGVVDGVQFIVAPPCPGTESMCGDDITGIPYINGAFSPGFTHALAVGDFMGFDTVSPGGTFDFAPLFVFGETFPCAVGALPPIFPGLCISGTTSSVILAGGPTGPFGLSLVLPPAPGFNVTYGPNPGIAGMCIKVQGVAVSPLACNTFFASTDCHTFSF